MSEQNHIDPTPETLANRQAGMDMMTDAAKQGHVISLMTFDLMRLAEPYYVNTEVDFADDDDSWDDIRPY